MQLLSSSFKARIVSSRCTGRSQRGLPAGCSARQLIRPKRTCLKVAAVSDNAQNHAQSAASTPHNQLVPQNGTSHGSNLAPAAATPGQSKVNVHFEVPEYLTHWGQVLKVVGSLEELGNWKVEKAPKMQWHEGHTWTLDIQLPVGAVNFKVVMQEPHGGVRWEEGNDRSVMIPETTSVTGAPVGEVDVTCNFNDVHNSRIEVRPDRNYLKQQLKAVEARVMTIQEKKRKLDQRMSLLTEGIKKYDQTVSFLEGDVQDAIAQRQRSKEAAVLPQLDGPQQVQQTQQSSPASTTPAAAVGPQSDSRGSIMVPILSPEELPSFEGLTYSTAESSVDTAEEIAAATAAAGAGVGGDVSSAQSQDDEGKEDAEQLAESTNDTSAATPSTDITAIKASHVNETVLSATVDQLLAAAEDALARSSSTVKQVGSSAPLRLDSNGVNNSQLAEEYVEELLAAASALEQQADQRASLLLEAAKQSGNDVVAADIEQLTVTPVPKMPSPNELAEAAAAAAVAAAAEEFTAVPDEEEENSITLESQSSTAAVEGVELALGDDGKLRAEAAVTIETPAAAAAQPASTQADKDGTITFTAESLNAQVDAKDLLAAVLKRIGLPMSAMGQVTISATFTPAASQEEQQDEAGTAQQQLEQDDAVGADTEAEEEEQDGQREITSPAQAIAAAIGAAAASRSGNGKGFGRSSRSSRGGNNGAAGRYSKQKEGKMRDRDTAATAAQVADDDISVHGRYLDMAQQAEKQLAAKEAARRAAAEKVAVALAQVEEMRQSVVAANSILAAQLHTGSEYSPAAAPAAGTNSNSDGGEANSRQGPQRKGVSGSSGTYSKYKVSYNNGGRNGSRQLTVNKSAAVEGPRSMPTVAAAAVMPQGAWRHQQQQQATKVSGDDSRPRVEGVVKEELLALAALAASVQSAVDVDHGHQPTPAEDEF